MLLWYNMQGDGSLIKDSLHGPCPILYGVKTSKLFNFLEMKVSGK